MVLTSIIPWQITMHFMVTKVLLFVLWSHMTCSLADTIGSLFCSQWAFTYWTLKFSSSAFKTGISKSVKWTVLFLCSLQQKNPPQTPPAVKQWDRQSDWSDYQYAVRTRHTVWAVSVSVKDEVRYDTIWDAILTCARKPTWIGLIYHAETTTKKCKTKNAKK